ncbi:MAG: glycogen-binding domain-containing protein [Limisphaerales bacterium]
MKEKTNHKINGNGSLQQKVRFQFVNPTAKSVSVAGAFNDWRPGSAQMVPLGNGLWVKDLVLAPGTYEYRLVVDDEWIPDPLCSDRVPNPFGGMNSVLKVPKASETQNGKSPSH